MINKKAQLGTAFSWFVGFLVVVFILFLFSAFSFGSVVLSKTSGTKNEISINSIDSPVDSEQQRQIFVLFESMYENKSIYSLVVSLVRDSPKEYFIFKRQNKKRILLEKALEDYSKIEGNCVSYDISEKTFEEGSLISPDRTVTRYIFVYPEGRLVLRWVDEEGRVLKDPSGSIEEYSFWYLLENFYLNKIKTECLNENAN